VSELLPPASTGLERALNKLVKQRLANLPWYLREVWNPQTCPEHLLPWLAWALSIDSWDATWPVHIKRARIASAIAVQRRKGTVQSVVDVVRSFGGAVRFREWWQTTPPGTPHTFHLNVALGGQEEAPSSTFIDQVIAEVQRTKPVRSHFDFTVAVNARGAIGLRGVARPIVYARLSCAAPVAGAGGPPPSMLTLGGEPLTLGGENLTLGV
jgi:phage tail P2-like protein